MTLNEFYDVGLGLLAGLGMVAGLGFMVVNEVLIGCLFRNACWFKLLGSQSNSSSLLV